MASVAKRDGSALVSEAKPGANFCCAIETAMPHADIRPKLWYERHGAGDPMLFVTGFGISCAVFEPVLDLYAQRFECVTYDNRYSGRSAAPLRPTSIPELAADAVRLLDALELSSAHV